MKLFCFALPMSPSLKQSVFPNEKVLRNFSGLRNLALPRADQWVVGTLQEEAEQLAETIGQPVTVAPELCSRHYGAWSGRPLKTMSAEDLEKWLHDPKFVPPAGESRSMVYHRVVQWLRKIQTKDETVAVMADADIVRLLILVCLGLDVTWENLLDVAPTSWNILSYRTHWRLQTLSLPPEKSDFEITCGSKNDH
ncbi:histidine phosphatase family protein [Gluconobacter japonicus]|uniref:histidine phosphatase family protein n=1 Tax=Gluconobacter japonicus TaxID=376620 RepID=UPI0030804F2D